MLTLGAELWCSLIVSLLWCVYNAVPPYLMLQVHLGFRALLSQQLSGTSHCPKPAFYLLLNVVQCNVQFHLTAAGLLHRVKLAVLMMFIVLICCWQRSDNHSLNVMKLLLRLTRECSTTTMFCANSLGFAQLMHICRCSWL